MNVPNYFFKNIFILFLNILMDNNCRILFFKKLVDNNYPLFKSKLPGITAK